MSREGLLTVIGLLFAVLALVDPVRQRAFWLFAPKKFLFTSFVSSLICIEVPRIAKLLGASLAPSVAYFLDLATFGFPLAGLVAGWSFYRQADLRRAKRGAAVRLIETGLLENRFDEIRRILQRNREHLRKVSPQELVLLFDRRIVRAMTALRSFVHLELLADLELYDAVEAQHRHTLVEGVMREMVAAPDSPLRNAVIRQYGGDEMAHYGPEDRNLVDKTLQNPEWYMTTNAHYPLLTQALEVLRSGDLDADYNGIGRDYEASQGISSRSRCPIYLAEKTHVLAVLRAIEEDVDADLYVTDLFWLHEHILERSDCDHAIWSSDLANRYTPTPYAYLLREIVTDFAAIGRACLRAAVAKADGDGRPAAPGNIGQQLSSSWRVALTELARSDGKVSDDFKLGDIRDYLDFILQIRLATDRSSPGELLLGAYDQVNLEAWYELLLDPWRQLGVSPAQVEEAFRAALDSLDAGKLWVLHGRDRLAQDLGLSVP